MNESSLLLQTLYCQYCRKKYNHKIHNFNKSANTKLNYGIINTTTYKNDCCYKIFKFIEYNV